MYPLPRTFRAPVRKLSCGQVLEMLWRCLSTVRTMRPSMEDVAAMLADLLEED